MKVRIYKPAKSAMQSGIKNTKRWLMVPVEEDKIRSISPLTGWTSVNSTISQIRFEFDSKEEAVKFAEEKKISYLVEEPKERILKVKSYAENFTG